MGGLRPGSQDGAIKNPLQKWNYELKYTEQKNKKDYKMATPRSKTSKARSAQRQSHDALTVMPCGVCKSCGEKKRPHHICPACGAK